MHISTRVVRAGLTPTEQGKAMQRFGSVVSFTLPSKQHAERFFGASQQITEATSFGSVHTTAERRARWGGDVVPEGFIRLSAGCEAMEDILADIDKALRQADRT